MPPREEGIDEEVGNNPSVEGGSLSPCRLPIPWWVKAGMDILHGAGGNWKASW